MKIIIKSRKERGGEKDEPFVFSFYIVSILPAVYINCKYSVSACSHERMASSVNDFDRSFELFEHGNVEASFNNTQETSFDTSFDSLGFAFSAAIATTVVNDDEDDDPTLDRSMLFPEDPFFSEPGATSTTPHQVDAVRVSLQEQVSALYDDFSQEGSVTVSGEIHVKAASTDPITLKLIDKGNNLQRVQLLDQHDHSTADTSSNGVSCQLVRDDDGVRILRVQLDKAKLFRDVHVADYFATTTLRPVPLVSKFMTMMLAASYASISLRFGCLCSAD